MKLKYKILLILDCIVNLALGILLLLFPIGIVDLLGMPSTNTNFYPSILGAVLFGIGLALFLELVGYEKQAHGLGLGGAIVINTIGSFVFILWLIFGNMVVPLKGRVILWIISVLVFLISIAELATRSWIYEK